MLQRQKKERLKALVKGKGAQLKQSEKEIFQDDDAMSVHTNASRHSNASKMREQRDVLKKIGEKISTAEPKVTNTIENQLMKLSSQKKQNNPVLGKAKDWDLESVHSRLSKTGGLSRAKSTASLQSATSSVAT